MSADADRAPHPLALRLIARLDDLRTTTASPDTAASVSSCAAPLLQSNFWVLEIGTGSGRNARALESAGVRYVTIADAGVVPSIVRSATPKDGVGNFAAVLSTHGLLHGYPDRVQELVTASVERLVPSGLFYATFASRRDARFGQGEKLGETTFAPTDGDERGVPHTYFNESELRTLLDPYFDIERIQEVGVDTIAGSWAHAEKPLGHAVHWFVEARLRAP